MELNSKMFCEMDMSEQLVLNGGSVPLGPANLGIYIALYIINKIVS